MKVYEYFIVTLKSENWILSINTADLKHLIYLKDFWQKSLYVSPWSDLVFSSPLVVSCWYQRNCSWVLSACQSYKQCFSLLVFQWHRYFTDGKSCIQQEAGNRTTKKQQETWVLIPDMMSNYMQFFHFISFSFLLALLAYCLSKVNEHAFLGNKCLCADNKTPFTLNF